MFGWFHCRGDVAANISLQDFLPAIPTFDGVCFWPSNQRKQERRVFRNDGTVRGGTRKRMRTLKWNIHDCSASN